MGKIIKHTPTPWSISHMSGVSIRGKDDIVCDVTWLDHVQNEANAMHIITCVNAHDALVNALTRLCLLTEGYMRNPLSDDGVEYCDAKAQARAAIELANA